MAAHYNIHEVKNSRLPDDTPLYSVSLKVAENVTLDTIARNISVMSSFSSPDVVGLVDALEYEIARHLSQGHSVTLGGLGTFSISAELKQRVADPDSVTGNDIRLKRICFKPTPDFKNKVEEQISFKKYKPIIQTITKE